MVCGIGAVHDSGNATGLRGGSYAESKLPVFRETHLRQVIEIVFADGDDIGAMAFDGIFDIRLKGGVEENNVVAAIAKHRCADKSLQRWIRLHLFALLAVREEVIRMGEED